MWRCMGTSCVSSRAAPPSLCPMVLTTFYLHWLMTYFWPIRWPIFDLCLTYCWPITIYMCCIFIAASQVSSVTTTSVLSYHCVFLQRSSKFTTRGVCPPQPCRGWIPRACEARWKTSPGPSKIWPLRVPTRQSILQFRRKARLRSISALLTGELLSRRNLPCMSSSMPLSQRNMDPMWVNILLIFCWNYLFSCSFEVYKSVQ